jgi:6-phosphogluconolactonase (cycloisomerase 2 family)
MSRKMLPTFSRRCFLKRTAATAAYTALHGGLVRAAESNIIRAYVGTYTTSVDGSSHGEGIYLFDIDSQSGQLSNRQLAAKMPNPSWIAIHPSKKSLYAINEVTDFAGGNGSLSALAIDAASGGLTLLNTVSSAGAGPAHMSLDRSGKFAFVANYVGGSIAVLPIEADGRLGNAVDVHHDIGSIGSAQATNAPRGSFAISGHDTPHAHMIAATPDNNLVLATDLGQDRIYIYRFNAQTGKLIPNGDPVSLPSGDGPRHFSFHPNGRWLYLLEEEASVIVFFHFDPEHGSLSAQQTVSALPPGFAGTNFGSEIQISPDGRFLLSANRLHNTLCLCAIATDGRLTRIGEASTMGDYPRHFAFGPSGNFIYVCDQRSDCVTSFKLDHATGQLAFTGNYAAAGSPAMIAFLS